MSAMACKINSLTIVYCSPLIQKQIKENIKALRHWPLYEEFTGTGEFPAQMANNAENVSIWWRHQEKNMIHFKVDRGVPISFIISSHSTPRRCQSWYLYYRVITLDTILICGRTLWNRPYASEKTHKYTVWQYIWYSLNWTKHDNY